MIILKKIKARIEKIKERIRKFFGVRLIKSLRDLIIFQQTYELQKSHANPLNSFGKKCFSQTDEDGITLEIIKRMGIKKGVFAEFGAGDGTENNTICLAALGWKGFWIGGEDLKFNYNDSENFLYKKSWITKDNAFEFFSDGYKTHGIILNSFGCKCDDILWTCDISWITCVTNPLGFAMIFFVIFSKLGLLGNDKKISILSL